MEYNLLRLTINVKNLTLPPIVFRYFSSFNFENGVLNLGWGDRFLCCTAFHSLIDIVSKLLNTYFAERDIFEECFYLGDP
ncbi:unnamed protein product [Rhizophagus irregularis]|nr:unnamed protein product [Rhizophagus irregularis]